MLLSRQHIQRARLHRWGLVVVVYVSASDDPPTAKPEPRAVQPCLVVREMDESVVSLARFRFQELNIRKRPEISLPSLVYKGFLKLACHQEDITVVQQKRKAAPDLRFGSGPLVRTPTRNFFHASIVRPKISRGSPRIPYP